MSSLKKHFLQLIKGSVVSKLITLATMPVVTRIYESDDIGKLGVFTSACLALSSVAALMYQLAIPLAKRRETALNILVGASFISFANCVLFYMFFSIFERYFFYSYDGVLGLVSMYLEVIVLFSFFICLYEISTFWLTRSQQFSSMSKALIAQTLVGAFLKIGGGLAFPNLIVLAVGQGFQQCFAVTFYCKSILVEIKRARRHITAHNIKLALGKFSMLPKIRLQTQIMLLISLHMPIFIISSVYGFESAGQYSLALLITSMPVVLFSNNIGKVYFSEIAKLKTNHNFVGIYDVTIRTIKRVSVFGFSVAAVIALFSPTFFPIIFGPEWAMAGIYASLLCLYTGFQFSYNVLGQLFLVLSAEKIQRQNQIFRLLIIAFVFFAVIYYQLSLNFALLLYSVFLSISYVFGIYQAFTVLGKYNEN